VYEVRVDLGIEDFCDDPDLVSHPAEFSTKVGGIALGPSFGEGTFAPDDGNFHWRDRAFRALGRQGGKRFTGYSKNFCEAGVVIGEGGERAEEAVAILEGVAGHFAGAVAILHAIEIDEVGRAIGSNQDIAGVEIAMAATD